MYLPEHWAACFEGENFEQEERWEKKQEKRRRDESIQERSRGSGYFFWAHNKVLADPHLSHSEVRVYMGLATFGGCRVISPGMERIAQRSGVSPRTVWQAIKKLEDLELVHVRRNAKGRVSHVYRLLRSHNGCRHCVQAEINRRAIQEMEKRERNLEYDEFDLERDLK